MKASKDTRKRNESKKASPEIQKEKRKKRTIQKLIMPHCINISFFVKNFDHGRRDSSGFKDKREKSE